MKEILIEKKIFKLYITQKQIEKELKRIVGEITRDLSQKKPLFICLLNGSFIFAADLIKNLDFNCNVSFVKLKSYDGSQSTGKVLEIIGLNESVENRTVVIIDDIIDTGTTLFYLLKQLKDKNPLELKIASMFFKPDACRKSMKIDYLGMTIENKYVIGYGLDYNGLGRNYRDLYILSET